MIHICRTKKTIKRPLIRKATNIPPRHNLVVLQPLIATEKPSLAELASIIETRSEEIYNPKKKIKELRDHVYVHYYDCQLSFFVNLRKIKQVKKNPSEKGIFETYHYKFISIFLGMQLPAKALIFKDFYTERKVKQRPLQNF